MTTRSPSSERDPSTWVDTHGDALYRFALISVKDPQVAEDLVQDTFIAGLEGLGSFKGGSSIRTWLIGILKHKVIDYFRKQAREVPSANLDALEQRTEEDTFNRLGQWRRLPGKWRSRPDNLLEDKEFLGILARCLDDLPDAFRRAFSLREIDGLKSNEVCKILDITATNLWVILHRARVRLRDCLEASWFGSDTRRKRGTHSSSGDATR
ncbi:MAG: sigma-70 family RNA polymerase sigma factor [bacterium]